MEEEKEAWKWRCVDDGVPAVMELAARSYIVSCTPAQERERIKLEC